MERWADYLVSAVEYDSGHKITRVKQHKDIDGQINKGEIIDRMTLVNNLKHGKTYMTIFSSNDNWRPGDPINIVKSPQANSIRTDDNEVQYDNLKFVTELKS